MGRGAYTQEGADGRKRAIVGGGGASKEVGEGTRYAEREERRGGGGDMARGVRRADGRAAKAEAAAQGEWVGERSGRARGRWGEIE